MSKTTEQRLELLESSVLSLTQALAGLTQALASQAQALDALAAAIDGSSQAQGEDDMPEPVSFLSQRR